MKLACSNMTVDEWEKICRRCGRCCLLKLEDEDTGEVYFTNVVCRYYDLENNLCTIYDKREEVLPSCLKLTSANVDKLSWMPKVCAYRKLFDKSYKKKDLRPLKDFAVSETKVREDELEDHIVAEEEP